MKLGGNGPIMANALAAARDGRHLHRRISAIPTSTRSLRNSPPRDKSFSIAEPGHTDALEFDDGKLMLGKITTLNDVNWPNFAAARVGEGSVDQAVRSESH